MPYDATEGVAEHSSRLMLGAVIDFIINTKKNKKKYQCISVGPASAGNRIGIDIWIRRLDWRRHRSDTSLLVRTRSYLKKDG